MSGAGARRPPAVARVLERVVATARRHTMFPPGSTVVAAVSGGPDSICLLHALWRVRRLARVKLACFHFDHRLREGSERDAAYVRAQAARLGLPFVMRRATSAPERGESVEAWARTARYEALADVLVETSGSVAAVGHTQDDQAETVLLALLRGGGLQSLAAMRPVTGRIVRPLLEVTRAETEAFCRALHLRPRRDPMNEDPAYLRAAIRGRVVPALEAAVGRGVRSTLARTAANLREDADFLEALAAAAAADAVTFDATTPEALLRADALAGLPRPVAARLARRSVLAMGALPEAAHVEAILDLAAGRPGRRASLGGGLAARREREYVRLFLS